jgi:hypothetical protein
MECQKGQIFHNITHLLYAKVFHSVLHILVQAIEGLSVTIPLAHKPVFQFTQDVSSEPFINVGHGIKDRSHDDVHRSSRVEMSAGRARSV